MSQGRKWIAFHPKQGFYNLTIAETKQDCMEQLGFLYDESKEEHPEHRYIDAINNGWEIRLVELVFKKQREVKG